MYVTNFLDIDLTGALGFHSVLNLLHTTYFISILNSFTILYSIFLYFFHIDFD